MWYEAWYEMFSLFGKCEKWPFLLVAGEGLDTTSQINSTKTTSCRHGQPRVSCVCDTGASAFWQRQLFEV